jgi:hypothetical protein
MTETLAQLAGDRPEAATEHRPEIAGAALDARHSLARAASALATYPPAAWPPGQRATVHRLLNVVVLGLRDLDSVVDQLRAGDRK